MDPIWDFLAATLQPVVLAPWVPSPLQPPLSLVVHLHLCSYLAIVRARRTEGSMLRFLDVTACA